MTTTLLLETDRLVLHPLTEHDNDFIYALVNTEGWLKFIGNRNVNSAAEAVPYIQGILGNTTTRYWTVKHKQTLEHLGVVTLIQRDYLDHPDIGFAFLPNAWGTGYALEATQVMVNHLRGDGLTRQLFAVILPDNASSIRLISKLGFVFEREIQVASETLQLYTLLFSR